ncbi:MAG: 2-hydroxyacid dehydrogenase [Dehalococcoidales bacterium]
MKILGLTDMVIKEEQLGKVLKETFPEAEVRYLRWPPSARDVFSKENLNIEKNGPEVGMPVPGVMATIDEFDPEIIIVHFAPVTHEVIEKAKSLEIIGCLRGGVENINVAAATKRNILVFNNSGRTANAVAEFALAHMLVVSRNTSIGYHLLQNGQWWKPETQPSEIYGSTIGLIGFGAVSQKLAERLQGFKVKLLAYDPYIPDEVLAEYGAKRVELKELLSQSDFVSLHSRLTPETQNIIGEAELKLMKPTAYLINTARADLIDKNALINALQTKQIRGAALDVFWQEPLSKDDPLLKLNNVSLTPHLAGATVQTGQRTMTLLFESMQEFLKTHKSRSIVNFKAAEQAKIAETMKLGKKTK